MSFAKKRSAKKNSEPPQTEFLGLLTAILYGLLTIWPDNSTLIFSWPWVLIWQVTLFLPWLWLLRHWWMESRVTLLGYKLDLWAGLTALVLLGSTLFAPFPNQARWYGWSALCYLAALYALRGWCNNHDRRLWLLKAQGGLAIAVVGLSLVLWGSQTLLPELSRLDSLRAAGLNLSYDFSTLELRNWAPFGHQNYVAGYVILNLPLLLALSLIHTDRWRWFWGAGIGLSLLDLYTTNSRAGWLGLVIIGVLTFLALVFKQGASRIMRGLGGLGLLAGLGVLFIANDRLRLLLNPTVAQEGGETAYRLITNTTGWLMGLAHPWLGVGPGGVPLLYQAYRPAWAGREAEALFQLHSTPAQIWAELGFGGVLSTLVLVGWLLLWGIKLWQKRERYAASDRIFIWSCYAAFAGYGVVSLTDFQLDLVAITGTLIVYTVTLLSLLQETVSVAVKEQTGSGFKILRWGLVGLLVAVGIWLIPIHRAWQLSSLAFAALDQKQPQVNIFTDRLEQAQELASWEPYYPHQLGWNLGQLGLQAQSAPLLTKATQSLMQGNTAAPNQEFGYSNLGWLQLSIGQPKQAITAFQRAAQLVPAKKGSFHSLGMSLLGQGRSDLAIEAFALEIVRDPVWLTSPIWRSAQLKPLSPKIQQRVIDLYTQSLKAGTANTSTLQGYLHQCLGGVYWWQGNLAQAQQEWSIFGSPLSQTLLAVSGGKPFPTAAIAQPKTAIDFLLKAWQEPQQRSQWVAQALLHANSAIPDPKQVEQIATSMAQTKTFDDWIRNYAPVNEWRRERAGFGVLSRHIDGAIPKDFYPLIDNLVTTQFFLDVFPSPFYLPDLDKALQPVQNKLLAKVGQS